MTAKVRNSIAAGLAAAGIIMIALGTYRGEIEVVFRKAIMVCLECIGLG